MRPKECEPVYASLIRAIAAVAAAADVANRNRDVVPQPDLSTTAPWEKLAPWLTRGLAACLHQRTPDVGAIIDSVDLLLQQVTLEPHEAPQVCRGLLALTRAVAKLCNQSAAPLIIHDTLLPLALDPRALRAAQRAFAASPPGQQITALLQHGGHVDLRLSAFAVNPWAGDHPMPTPTLLEAALDAVQEWADDHHDQWQHLGPLGCAFAQSDAAWMVTFALLPQAATQAQMRWLEGLYHARLLPRTAMGQVVPLLRHQLDHADPAHHQAWLLLERLGLEVFGQARSATP